MQEVRPAEVDQIQIECRSKFHITVPRSLPEEKRAGVIRVALEDWLKGRAEADLQIFTRRHAKRLKVGVTPGG